MCGRYKVTPGEFSDLKLRFNLEEIPLFKPRCNIAPTQQAPVPVMLSDSNALDWLKGDEIEHALSLLKPFPAELMDGYDVSKMVNSPQNDTPGCIAPN